MPENLAVTLYLLGWALGTLAIHTAATRTWRNPKRHRQLVALRASANTPLGMLAFAFAALMIWWVYVVAVPWDVWRDLRWRADGGDGDG